MAVPSRSFRASCAVAAVVAAVAAAPLAQRSPPPDYRAGFREPAKAYRPYLRWWWPGGGVSDDELRRELGQFDAAHVGGVEILPLRHEAGPDDATPALFAHVAAASAEAGRLGLTVAMALGFGEGFDGAVAPEHAAQELRATYTTLQGPQAWRTTIDARPLVALVAVKGGAPAMASEGSGQSGTGAVLFPGRLDPKTAVVLTERVGADGAVAWSVPAGQWQMFVFTSAPIAGPAAGAARSLLMDPLQQAAVEAQLRVFGDAARQAGAAPHAVWLGGLPPSPAVYWTASFPADFRRLRGYDLLPYLPFVWRTASGRADETSPLFDAWDVGDRVRHDYWRTVADLLGEGVYAPVAVWAAANGLEARMRTADWPVGGLALASLAPTPEAAAFRGQGSADASLLAASAAHVNGRPIVAGEAFGGPGSPFDVTPAGVKRAADALLLAGINQIVYHGAPYDRGGPGDVPWYPFTADPARTALIGPGSTFWPYMTSVNDYVSRLQYVFQQGQPATDVALFRSDTAAPVAPGSLAAKILEALRVAGYAVDLVSDEGVRGARMAQGRLTTAGGAQYGALVIVDEPRLEAATVERMAAFRRGGLAVVLAGRKPSNEAGFNDWEARGQRIRDWLAPIAPVHDESAVVAAVRAAIPAGLDRHDTDADVFVTRRHLGPMEAYLFWNRSAASSHAVDVGLTGAGAAERWDPWTGAIAPEAAVTAEGSRLRARFSLTAGESRLVVLDPRGVPAPVAAAAEPPSAPALRPITIEGPWDLQMGDDTRHLPSLLDWAADAELAAFSGTARYSVRFVVDDAWFSQVRTNSVARPVGASRRAILDLGRVASVAEVSVNSQRVATLLMPPYVADISLPLRPGDNRLEVLVTNSLANRLRARRVYPAPPRPSSPESAGLLGPVTIALR